jgi:hypothetical protein
VRSLKARKQASTYLFIVSIIADVDRYTWLIMRSIQIKQQPQESR